MHSKNEIIVFDSDHDITLMPPKADKDALYRIGKYQRWLTKTHREMLQPDLREYRDYLLNNEGLAPSTVSTHLGTLRGRYRDLLGDYRLRDLLYQQTLDDVSPADRKAEVDERILRLEMAINPSRAQVKLTKYQDVADSEFLRLKASEAESLMQQPEIKTLRGLRDTAIIGLLLCTGIRENELRMLDVIDLRQTLNNELCLHVRSGKGAKQRLIPYGELSWILLYVEKWLKESEITEGAIFRGFYKGYSRLRNSRISLRQISYILDTYPIMINGELRKVKPHDLRRTYARRLFDAGVDINRIRENLGHESIMTTLRYIGEISPHERRPPAIYQPPHTLVHLESTTY